MRVAWPVKFAVLCLVWGASFLLMKVGLEALAPVQVAMLRIVSGAATVLVAALIMRTRFPRSLRVWGHLVVAGLVLCVIPFTLFPLGEERVSSALAGIGNATTPLSVVLFTLLLMPTQRVDRRTLVAVLTGFLGVMVILQPWQAQGRPDLLGFGMTLLAGGSYGLGWTYVKRFLQPSDIGGLGLPAGQLLMASGEMLLIGTLWWWWHRGEPGTGMPAPWSLPPGAAPLGPVAAILALGVVGTGLAFVLQFDIVREVGPTIGATVTYVIPVVAVVLGVVFLHERLSMPQLVGAAIVLGSAVVIGRPRRSAATTPPGSAGSSGPAGQPAPAATRQTGPNRSSTGRS